MMQCSRKLKVTDLNPHLICVLCGGYFVDATTIIECLHSFCRSCIVRYLETNKYCPICDVQVHKTRPLQNIRPDDTLQTIVYKLVPGLYQNEMRCRREFYAKQSDVKLQSLTPEARGELTDQSRIFLPDEPVSLCLEYVGAPNNTQSDQQGTWGRRYLRCPAAVSVSHLHKLIRAKFGLAMGHKVDVFYKEDILPNNWTLMDIAYIYQWKRKNPIHLSYQILENQRKKIKLSHESVSGVESSEMDTLPSTGEINTVSDSKQGCPTILLTSKTPTDGVSSENVSTPVSEAEAAHAHSTTTSAATDSSNKTNVEWKEVQLQISENGVMSVAGVENNRLLSPMQPISVSSQSDTSESLVNKVSTNSKSDTVVDENLLENKVPPVNSDPNASALQEKKTVIDKCDSRTKPAVATTKQSGDSVSKIENAQNVETKMATKDINNHIDSFKRSNKSVVGYKITNSSDKTNAIFKSKTDKLEDTVRNIASRTEPAGKSDVTSKSAHVLTAPASPKESIRPKALNSESTEGRENSVSGTMHRPATSLPKVYSNVKPPIYNSFPKEEHTKSNNNKSDSLAGPGIKPTPMEILNTQNKLQNHMVKYKSHKASIKPWNPTISRAAVLAMKHSAQSANKETSPAGSTENSQLNPPPVKQPRFFKIRNMPRFLGNPASGVKPMYQVAPGSEIVTSNAAVTTGTVSSVASPSITTVSSSATNSNTNSNVGATTSTVASSDSLPNSCSVSTAISTCSTTSVAVTYAPQKSKQNSSSGLTLMKIDPKTLSPIPVNPATVPHVLNNPSRSTPTSQPKKLPPPFTPGSPKHSNHYTNCSTAHTNGSKNAVTRTPSPAHTGGLIPTHPFIPVSHANPHLLYSAFPNPFAPADPSASRLLPGPTNSEFIRAMSALCSSGSAFHPSLPPSISMLFNPHHAHHRTLPNERSTFKCDPNDKKAAQSPPPTVQRVPPSNPSSNKGFNETDSQHINMTNCNVDQSSRVKKSKTEHPSSPAVPSKTPKQMPMNSHVPTGSTPVVGVQTSSTTKKSHDNFNRPLTHQSDLSSTPNSSVPVTNCTPSENKKSMSPKPPGKRIEEITSELSVQNQKTENKSISKPNSNIETPTPDMTNNSSVTNNESSEKSKPVVKLDDKKNESKISVNNNVNETISKDEQLIQSINNNNNVNKIDNSSRVSTDVKTSVDKSVVNSNVNT